MTIFAVIGLGEAGALYARGLAAGGAEVRGFDPFLVLGDPAITQEQDVADAVAGVDGVISLVGAGASEKVATSVLPHLSRGAVYADLNTASPRTKLSIAEAYADAGVPFADVAVLAPVPRAGLRTPLMVSGSGSARITELLGGFGVPVEDIGGKAGDAASRKLLRSVFMKGLAALLLESTAAAAAAGQADWLRGQMEAELGPGSADLIDRLVDGSRVHARRRVHEVADAREFVAALGAPTWVTSAAHEWLTLLDQQNDTTERTPA